MQSNNSQNPKNIQQGHSSSSTERETDDQHITAPFKTSENLMAKQNSCPVCKKTNRVGVLICESCGANLVIGSAVVIGTRQISSNGTGPLVNKVRRTGEHERVVEVSALSNSAQMFTAAMLLRLEIEGTETPILVHPKSETSLGRRDPAAGNMPDVDLTAYAAYRLGVSRKHAILRQKEDRLEIYDLGSSNGTTVNGLRLLPHRPQLLRDGDELALGKMNIRISFQQPLRRTP